MKFPWPKSTACVDVTSGSSVVGPRAPQEVRGMVPVGEGLWVPLGRRGLLPVGGGLWAHTHTHTSEDSIASYF